MKVYTHFRYTLLGLILCFAFYSSSGQNLQVVKKNIDKKFSEISTEQVSQYPSLFTKLSPRPDLDRVSGTSVQIDKQALSQLVEEQNELLSLEIPYENDVLKIRLIKTNLGEVNVRLRSDGETINKPSSGGAFYHGYIEGQNNSIGAISFFEDNIYGMFSSEEYSNISFTKMGDIEYLIYPDKDFNREDYTFCSAEDEDIEYAAAPPEEGEASNSDNCVEVEWVITYALYQKKGAGTESYILGAFNNVQALYANEDINFKLKNLVINDTPDTYDYSSSYDYLDDFTDNYDHSDGSLLYHLVDYSGKGLGGIAYVDVLCYRWANTAYSDINLTYKDVPDYSWTIMVLTHETGHNLGSRHTQWCGWSGGALDNCYTTEGSCPPGPPPINGGTIMSYCHLTSYGINPANGFGPQPGDLIRDRVNNASCLSECEVEEGGCQNESAYGSATAPVVNIPYVSTYCNYAGEYFTLNSCELDNIYKITSSVSSDYLTVRRDSYDGPVVKAGVSPLSFTSPVDGALYIHINTDSDCGTQSSCRYLTIECTSCGDGHCLNESSYGSAQAPKTDIPYISDDCNWAGEYFTLYNCAVGNEYKITSSVNTDYLTVRRDTYDGTMVVSGPTPLIFNSPYDGTLYIHINTDSDCGTEMVCRYLTIECTSCDPLSEPDNNDPCNAETVLCDDVIIGNLIGATDSGEDTDCLWVDPLQVDVWYKFEADGKSTYLISLVGVWGYEDMLLSVYDGTCGSLVEIACSDDYYTLPEILELSDLSAGTYFIRVASYDLDVDFELSVSCVDYSCDIKYESDYSNGIGNLTGLALASDFPVAANEEQPMNFINFQLLYLTNSAKISLYEDDGGKPGQELFPPTTFLPVSQVFIGTTTGGTDVYDVRFDLRSEDITLYGGVGGAMYWLAIETETSSGDSYWAVSCEINNGTRFWGSLDNYQSWVDVADYDLYYDGSFSINCSPDEEWNGCGVNLYPVVMLQGAYDGGGMMHTALNDAGLLPLSQPYNVGPFTYPGTETVTTMHPNVVDWALVSLRDASDYEVVLETQAALLHKDGYIRSVTGGPLHFNLPNTDNYYVEVQHRNHLGILTATARDLSGVPTLDFTDQWNTPTRYVNAEAQYQVEPGVMAMYAGNVNNDIMISYLGFGNDHGQLLNNILGGNQGSALFNVYSNGDINMDGNVLYLGFGNDVGILLNQVLTGNQGNVIFRQY